MNTQPQTPRQTAHDSTRYQLRFQSLFDEGRGYAFPCDARGQVDLSLTLQVFRDDLTPSGLREIGQSLLQATRAIEIATARPT